jgi:hypothetical protein
MTRRRRNGFALAGSFVIAWIITVMPAHAVVTYTYTGNPFDPGAPGHIFDAIIDRDVIPGSFLPGAAITGWFTVDSPLPASMVNFAFTPSDFSFSDSRFTYTSDNALFRRVFRASTNASSNVVAWDVELQDIDPVTSSLTPLVVAHSLIFQTLVFSREIAIHGVCVPGDVTTAFCGEVNYDHRFTNDNMNRQGPLVVGTWTMALSVPEPSALALFIMSLAGIGLARLRKP